MAEASSKKLTKRSSDLKDLETAAIGGGKGKKYQQDKKIYEEISSIKGLVFRISEEQQMFLSESKSVAYPGILFTIVSPKLDTGFCDIQTSMVKTFVEVKKITNGDLQHWLTQSNKFANHVSANDSFLKKYGVGLVDGKFVVEKDKKIHDEIQSIKGLVFRISEERQMFLSESKSVAYPGMLFTIVGPKLDKGFCAIQTSMVKTFVKVKKITNGDLQHWLTQSNKFANHVSANDSFMKKYGVGLVEGKIVVQK